MKNVIALAKKFANKTTNFNEVQFLDAFNALSDDEQLAMVAEGSELSSILISWCAMARMEIEAGTFF